MELQLSLVSNTDLEILVSVYTVQYIDQTCNFIGYEFIQTQKISAK